MEEQYCIHYDDVKKNFQRLESWKILFQAAEAPDDD